MRYPKKTIGTLACCLCLAIGIPVVEKEAAGHATSSLASTSSNTTNVSKVSNSNESNTSGTSNALNTNASNSSNSSNSSGRTSTAATSTSATTNTVANSTVSNTAATTSAPSGPVKVLFIGGSVAHGWKDTEGTGYLHRAFYSLSKNTGTDFQIIDKTIVGANAQQMTTLYKGKYEEWLDEYQPQIIVISWGMLNDAKDKVPLSDFDNYIHNEIQSGLSTGAKVLVVTPPVTKASYTQYPEQEDHYVTHEIDDAKAFNSPDVLVSDVFNKMKEYLINHNETYESYMGDGWHPNTAGHVLAGHLLYTTLANRYNEIVSS